MAIPDIEYGNLIWTERFTYLDKLNLAKLAYNGKVLDLSRFSLMPWLPLIMMFALKVVKIDSRIIITLLVIHSLDQRFATRHMWQMAI